MIQLFGIKFVAHPAKDTLDEIPIIPFAFRTIPEVLWRRIAFPKATITEPNRFVIVGCDQFTKRIVMLVGRIPAPIDNFAALVNQDGPFDANDPAPIRFAFAPKLPSDRPSRRG